MKGYIVGIAGELNAGKDTFASMVNYIFTVGITNAGYHNWLTQRRKYDETYKHRIIHFADPMKDCLSIMFSIPREYFDDRVKKDEEWFVINGRRFISDKDSRLGHCYHITIDLLKVYSLDDLLNSPHNLTCVIKLRTLMQYFGTEIGRKQLGNNLWINATMFRAATIAETDKLCIIPHVRFSNEMEAIKGNSLYGGDVLVFRKLTAENKHDSEIIDFSCSINVNNTGTLIALFYQASFFVNKMLSGR